MSDAHLPADAALKPGEGEAGEVGEADRRGPPDLLVWAYGPTVFYCALVLLFCTQRHCGFMIGVVAVPWLVYTMYNLYRALAVRSERNWRLIRFLVWGICILAALGVQKKYELDARAEANRMVLLVKAYKAQHGRFPANRQEAGLGEYRDWPESRAGYFVGQEGPTLVYKTTWSPEGGIWFYFNQDKWFPH